MAFLCRLEDPTTKTIASNSSRGCFVVLKAECHHDILDPDRKVLAQSAGMKYLPVQGHAKATGTDAHNTQCSGKDTHRAMWVRRSSLAGASPVVAVHGIVG